MAFPASGLFVATFVDVGDTTQLTLDLDIETHKYALWTNTGTYDLTTAGYVRVRNIDPLKGISSLSDQQRGAGARYREDFEIANREGLNSGSFSEHVDGGSFYKGIPAHLLDATQAVRCANGALGHPKIIGVVEGVCGLGMSISAFAQRASDPRDAVIALLKVGLDKLADHYRPVKSGRH